MKALDMTPIIKKYRGYFVAISHDRKHVYGKGATAKEAIKKAREKGIIEPIITKVPVENRNYLL